MAISQLYAAIWYRNSELEERHFPLTLLVNLLFNFQNSLGLLLIVMKLISIQKCISNSVLKQVLLHFHLIFPRIDEENSHGRFEIDISIQLKQLIYAFDNSNLVNIQYTHTNPWNNWKFWRKIKEKHEFQINTVKTYIFELKNFIKLE